NGAMRSPSTTLLVRFDATASPEMWARAYRQLQADAMPPVGAPGPDRATSEPMLTTIGQALGGETKPPIVTTTHVAARLASLLWNSVRDAALLEDATHDRLRESAALERQVHRMLADDRARAFVSRFFIPWLQLDTLAQADPDTKYFPDYSVSLRDALAS